VLVLQGRVEVAPRRGGEAVALGAGETLGALALFAVGSRQVSAIGAEASELRLLRREEFLRFAEDHPRAAFRIAAAILAETSLRVREALAPTRVAPVDPPPAGE
jgi:CRP-like cAMP-binding protein